MKILIEYESTWRNSFLDGDNKSPLPKDGRKFVAASSSLNDRARADSFKEAKPSMQTILGILSRLIGDQRKLYQSQSSSSYYFKNFEDSISFLDSPLVSNEIVFIRNMTGSFDRESYTGVINTNHWLFNSPYSDELWGLAFLDLKFLLDFINNDKKFESQVELDPRIIVDRFNNFKSISITKLAETEVDNKCLLGAVGVLHNEKVNVQLKSHFPTMQKVFSDIEYIKSEKVDIRALYCSALYLKLTRLHEAGAKIFGNIKGFSVAGMTPKDFMSCFTKGKKMVYGNPYLKKGWGGEEASKLTKASGQLEITIDVDRKKAQEIKDLIENAGVSAFYLGKKGLAYVSDIRL
jgi:hypothetical protein